MTTKYRTKGFTIKKTDRKESDRVFSIFTRDFGRLEITGKAIRKINSKLKAGIDIFYLSDIEFINGKNNKTLTDASVIEKNNNIIFDSDKSEIACSFFGLLDNFVKGQQEDSKIWDLIAEVFEKLNNQKPPVKNKRLIYYYFLWNFFSVLGYRPEVQNCVVCRSKLNPYNIYFSNQEGGVICKKCTSLDKNAKKINSDIVKTLRLILNKNWEIISKLKIEPVSQGLFKNISDEYTKYVLPAYQSNLAGDKKYVNII